jgi:hypothetical protein
MLEPRPDLLAAWLELYDATVHGLTLGPRVGELVRRELARLLACPAWVTDGASALSDIDDQAVAILDPGILDAHERAALGYVRAVVLDDAPDAGVRAAIATELSMAHRVELGFAVAVQLGPLLVTRASTPASTALGWS